MPSGGDRRRGLRRQRHAELVQQDEVSAIGGGEVHIHHLDGGDGLDEGVRDEPAGARGSSG